MCKCNYKLGALSLSLCLSGISNVLYIQTGTNTYRVVGIITYIRLEQIPSLYNMYNTMHVNEAVTFLDWGSLSLVHNLNQTNKGLVVAV